MEQTRLPADSPQHLIVYLHHADGNLVVPVWFFLRYLREQQAQCPLVDTGVVGYALKTEGAEFVQVSKKINVATF